MVPRGGVLQVIYFNNSSTIQLAWLSGGRTCYGRQVGNASSTRVSFMQCTGVSTNNCVGMTAMEASDRGYSVVLASDATGTCSDEMQDAFIAMFLRLWGKVMTCDEIIAQIGDAASEEFASAG